MNLSKSLAYSLVGTLILLAGLSIFVGSRVVGIFLLLPIGLLLRSRKEESAPTDHPNFRRGDPIEPK
ncbi:hypothetical protein KKC97_06780 [bacterium]|nr:hypothetical protein [bacterium]